MKVYMASDHAGFALKEKLQVHFITHGLDVTDLGPDSDDRVDYPDFADEVCWKLKDNSQDLGLLICGSGQGMAMRANKHPHIRAALCWNKETATLAREHNNANVLCLGSRVMDELDMEAIIGAFFKTEFAGGRHENRVKKISKPL